MIVSALSNFKKSGGPHRQPRADVYTVLLIVALMAVLWANLLLYFLGKEYDFDYKGGPGAVAVRQYDSFAARLLPELNTRVDSASTET